MVGVAQLAEHRVVVPEVAGSSPVTHPRALLGREDISNCFLDSFTYEQNQRESRLGYMKISTAILITVLIFFSPLYAELVKVEVRRGNTLHGFASKYLKDPSQWPKIYELNNKIIKDPDKIFPGQIIKIPIEMLKDKVGDLTKLQNNVNIKKREGGDWQKGAKGERLFPEDGILTGKKSFARVDFLVGSNLKIHENSLIYLKPTKIRTAVASLLEGGLNVSYARIITPSAEVVPKGESIYDIDIDKNKTTKVSVRNGEVDVKALGKTVAVVKGYRTVVEFNKVPELPIPLPLRADEALEFKDDILANSNLNFYLQVASVVDFEDIVKDEETSDISMEYIKKGLKPGKYYYRIAVVDKDGFKGDFSRPEPFVIRILSDALVELTGFEIIDQNEGIIKVTGYAKNAKSVVVNGYPSRLENGEFETTIVLTGGQPSITVTAIGEEGIVLRKYRRTDDGLWLPAK